jgi:hypothetical protein
MPPIDGLDRLGAGDGVHVLHPIDDMLAVTEAVSNAATPAPRSSSALATSASRSTRPRIADHGCQWR